MTQRVSLETLQVDHAAEMVSVLGDAALYVYTGGEPPTLADLTRRYTAMVAGSGSDDEEWHNWIVRLKATGEAIGFVQATIEPAATEVAWTIGEPWQGNGYATEAASLMRQELSEKGVTTLAAWIHPDHMVSHRVARSLGLSPTEEVDEDGELRWTTTPSAD